jgi:hypothetical protein
MATRRGIDTGGGFVGFVGIGDDAPRVFQITLPGFGGTHVARGTIQQLDAQIALPARRWRG